jgi:hypothetical protein
MKRSDSCENFLANGYNNSRNMKVILAKDSVRGEKYLSPVLPTVGRKLVIKAWDKEFDRANKKVVVGVTIQIMEIDKIITVPPDYQLEEIEKTVVAVVENKEIKETAEMENTAPAPADVSAPAKSKKETRSELRTAIKELRDKRKAVSNETIEIKKQLRNLKTRAERKPLVEKIKINVALRKTMSADIKSLATEIKALKAE